MNEHAMLNRGNAKIRFGHFDGWVDGKAQPATSGERLTVVDPSTAKGPIRIRRAR